MERGKYGIEWVRFLDKERIKEYPILPGSEYVRCKRGRGRKGNKLELNEDGVGGIAVAGQGGYGEKW